VHRFIAAYNEVKLRSPHLTEDELLTSAADVLQSSGVILQSVVDIRKVCFLLNLYCSSVTLLELCYALLQCLECYNCGRPVVLLCNPRVANGDVTNFDFTFDNMQILTTFQLFDVRRIVRSTSVEYEYFILCYLTEFN